MPNKALFNLLTNGIGILSFFRINNVGGKNMKLTTNNTEIMSVKKELISELIRIRNEKGLSQSQFEQLANVPQPVIARLEKNNTNPTIITLLKLLIPLRKTIKIVDIE